MDQFGNMTRFARADDRSGSIHRAAVGFGTIYSFIFAFGVDVPDDFAVGGRVGAKVAVFGAGEDCSGDDADGRGLGRAAPRPVGAWRRS